MRPIETLIPIVLAIYLIGRHPRPYAARFLPAVALVLTLLHFAVEGYRWQMVPIYTSMAVLGLSALHRIKSGSDWKPLASFLGLFLLAVSTVLPILLPVPSIPAPDGQYVVGATTYELTDTARKELYSGKDEARRFQIQVWYPAEPGPSDERAPWMNQAEVYAPFIADYIRMPDFFLDHLALVKIPATRDSKVADGAFPVILFSHGWNGFSAQNTGQALQLASHGYVVVGVQHTYGAVVTVFDDGTIAPNNPSALPRGAPDEIYDPAADTLVDQWAGDLAFALDFLTRQNGDSNSHFFQRLDLSKVGVYGHSTGGGAAIQFCGTDPRCKALLGQDPFMRPVSTEVLESGVMQPSFYMFSEVWANDADSLNNRQFEPFYQKSPQAVEAIKIEGTSHYDFSDLPRLSPLAPALGLKGPIGAERVTTIIDDYLLAFFEASLRGGSAELFEPRQTEYSEVQSLNSP